ncbi:hypothetical protein TCAL_03352 [Tigriopus californicus]|uniref:LIM zinc-binding domain-containing protein n=1 Tax=Tigriopus californicus TaxID=6832 RepID=A0A553P6F9_TIGCA|nr:transforming growth factor beta-1-induced transcript 1 protein-like [Tigriopus californicus]TRY73262.1 hypothetical protein TCAL_03352 [Tigriopus californicus]|eukprot:TCALIF_03352-PA protein Name:"Similar to Pxn Paxillin (Rattus norvegicus)" AED:0.02 eAED:0.02 QI:750/1/1/1/0.8/0.66/6/607/482
MLKHKGNNNHIANNSSSNNNFNNAEKVFDPGSRLGEYLGGSVGEKKWVAGPGAGMRRAIATGGSQRPTGDSSSNLANEELQKVHPSEEERINQKRVSVKRALNNLDELLDQLRPTMDHPKEALDESRDDQPHRENVEQSLSQVSALMEHLVNQAELNHDDTDPSQCLDQTQCPDQSRKTSTASVASSNSSASSLSSLIEDKSRNQSREASAGPDNFSEATTSRKTSHAESLREVEDQVDSLTKQLTECLETKEVVNWSRDIKSTTIFGNCPKCDQPIEKEASVVGESHYHPGCFICEGCQEPLGTQSFFIIDGKNYCSKDRERFLEKCVKCMEKIEGDTIRPRESGEAYHPSCFSCQQCSKELFGKYYDINGQLICEDDYIASREKCCKCREAIIGTVLKALDGVFHPECFTCAACPLCLDGVQFFLTEDEDPLCETCYTRLAAKRCDGCKEPIVEDCLVSKDPGGYYHKNCYTERVGPSRS